MPHQQRVPSAQKSQSQSQPQSADQSSIFHQHQQHPNQQHPHQGSFFPYGHNNPNMAGVMYGHGMMPNMNPNHPMFCHPNALGEWNNIAAAVNNSQHVNNNNSTDNDDNNNNSNTTDNSPIKKEEPCSDNGSEGASASNSVSPSTTSNDNKKGSSSNNNSSSVNNNTNNTNNNLNNTNTKSNESDEEAAATALLMAGGRRSDRSEDVELVQAAIRKKKQRMLNQKMKEKHQQQHQEAVHRNNHNSTNSIKRKVTPSEKDKSKRSERDKRELRREGSNGSSSSHHSHSSSSPVIVKDFPNVLHQVLTKSEYSGTVLEWLSHGKSWRVLRWDELSETVIPAYFPGLCSRGSSSGNDKKSSAAERMNMFIRQIKAWGFKEVREVGPDLGSFHHEFFMKIAPNLCRHMKIVRKGTKRPSDGKIVSPPRRGPKGRFSIHSAPALNPGFSNTSEAFKVKQRVSNDTPKRKLFTENREEVNGEASSPGSRSGARCVSFQERLDIDDSSPQSSQRLQRPPFESPRSLHEMNVNYVSPNSLTQWVGNSETSTPNYKPRLSLRSNRGGSRASSRVVETDEKYSSSASRGTYPVSNRGRGSRSVSSRGRSSKVGSLREENIDETPMIVKKIEQIKASAGEHERCT